MYFCHVLHFYEASRLGGSVGKHIEWRLLCALFLTNENLRNFFMESRNIATVDAYGVYFSIMLIMLLYIGVGFVVACFDSKGIAKAFVRGTSKESFLAFFIRFQTVLRQG